jgi:hypothetical protein
MDSRAYEKLLRSAAADEPSAQALGRLRARLAPQLGAAPRAGSLPRWPLGAGIGIVAIAALGVWLAANRAAPPAAPEARTSIAAPPRLAAPQPAPRPATSVPRAPAVPEPERPRAARPAPASAAARDDLAEEVRILRAAEQSLASSPGESLRLGEEHRRRFPRGTLAQEREVVAIDALVRLGRMDAARTRAERFGQSYPGSSHAARVEALVGAP